VTSAALDQMLNKAFAHHQTGELTEAEKLYRAVLTRDPDNLNALQLLGLLVHARDRSVDGLALLERAAAVADRRGDRSANYAVLHNNLANALRDAGRIADAAAHYRRGIALDPGLAELHENLGNVLLAQKDADGAVASYEEARRLGRITPTCLCRLAGAYAALDSFAEAQERFREAAATFTASPEPPSADAAAALAAFARILLERGKPQLAVEVGRALVKFAPADPDALHLLGRALRDAGNNTAAIAALRACVDADPQRFTALYDLGMLAARVGLGAAAVPILEQAVAIRPDHAGAHVELGNLLQGLGETERAFAHFQRATALRPLTTWPARQQPPAFAVLLVTSPGAGNTPPDFLLGQAAFDCHFYALLPDAAPDLDLLRAHGDIAVNLISDVDQGGAMLPAAADLFDRLGKPAINHPRKILRTGRDAVVALLSGLPGSGVPATIRCTRAELAAPDASARLQRQGIAFPLLLRVAGTHGGDAFEKLDRPEDIAAFLAQHAAEAFYATAYVDYRSADGYFRKYRFIFTNGEILPYHLAIADQWKVHHFRTDMGSHRWMQDEEKAFLDHPDQVFSAAHYDALRRIRAALDLEFFGIDCALDRDRNLIVFEVNASMLIHDDNAAFPYKTPACARIKQAFTATLTRAARSAEQAPPRFE